MIDKHILRSIVIMFGKNWFILFILFTFYIAIQAGEPIHYEKSRPKIGLVLSGGGARGFAHIGALKVIDSLKIPIDYVAGTSIGAIVGGLYAAGYSIDKIDSLAHYIDWPLIFSDEPTRQKRTYLEKWDDGRFQLPLAFENFKIIPPSGLIYGQKVSLLLSRLTLEELDIVNFDSLQIPFRCIAADLVTGNEVVLERGSLSKAIRASMSVPSIFTPVAWGDSLLVDGGVLNNLPVDVCKKMGAEYIIAVNVGTPMRTRDELNSALSILLQSFSLAGYQREQINIAETNVLITPDLENYSNTDFDRRKVDGMISQGKKAAYQQLELLQPLSRFAENQKNPGGEVPLKEAVINSVFITGNKKLSFHFIYQLLGIKPGQPLNLDLLESRIGSLYGLGYFETVTYRIEHHRSNRYNLMLEVKEKPTKLLRLGVKYQDDKKIIVGVNLKMNDFPAPGFRNDLTYLFSGVQLVEWELSYPRRMLGSRVFPYLYGFYQDYPVTIFFDHEKIASYQRRSFGGAPGLGLIVKNYGVIKVDYMLEKLLIKPTIASPGEIVWPAWEYPQHLGRLYAEVDLLDDPLKPTHGYFGRLGYEKTLDFIKQEANYSRIFLDQNFYGTIIPRITTSLHIFLGFSKQAEYYRQFYLGGPDQFVGADYDEFAGPNIGIYRVENRFHWTRLISLLGIYNVGNIWESYKNPDISKNQYTGYGIGIQVDTVVGPLRYVIGHGEGNTIQYFTFGFSLNTRNDERLP
jgi:NTE family protein